MLVTSIAMRAKQSEGKKLSEQASVFRFPVRKMPL